MENYILWNGSEAPIFMVDSSTESGIVKIAEKVLKDFSKVTSREVSLTPCSDSFVPCKNGVLFAVTDKSPLLLSLEKQGIISLNDIRGKREVWKVSALHAEAFGVENLLIIAGSDKLGAIYGMFSLSEKMGVSPLATWADGVIPTKDRIVLTDTDFITSSEPAVKFRGFFINDEWPCFGNWTVSHFGGFTAEMYDRVFELLLRLKGNYLWPAMWSSSFALDGPGLASYELATEYGIFIGNSHHEPCLRAGEEYRKVRGPESIYGDAWSFIDNEQGITRFWKDSLEERGGFDSVVTVGMRGEADSTILGEKATLKDNIDLLKGVITCQKKLLAEAESKFNKKFPKMLALYKEVEPFYYGDEKNPGLIDWDELKDITLMLCEDNHGYVRTLPGPRNKNHPGGFGMYYHVDYHGDPISYEWINSTPITLIWEQMKRAYEYGVKEIWILNVGDLKHNEFPLSFFLNLAYSPEAFKDTASLKAYTRKTVGMLLGVEADSDIAKTAADILTETVRLNGMRRPEALNSAVYSPNHFGEAERMLKRAERLENKEKQLKENLSPAGLEAWYSLSGFQTEATVNLLRMHLNAGINNMLALLGLKTANAYADKVTEAIRLDNELKKEWASFKDGEWKGMELAPHIGFTKWNEDGCRYPVRALVEPLDRPHMAVKRADGDKLYDKVYGTPMNLEIKDFLYPRETSVDIDLYNTGTEKYNFDLTMPESSWLSVSETAGEVEDVKRITLKCNRGALPEETEKLTLTLKGGDTTVLITVYGRKSADERNELVKPGVIFEGRFGYVIPSDAYLAKTDNVYEMEDYGVWGMGLAAKDGTADGAFASYLLYSESERTVTLECDFAPSAPLFGDGKLEFGLSVNSGDLKILNTAPKGYRPGNTGDRNWSLGALNHRRGVCTDITLTEGVNEIKIQLKDPGLVLLRMFVYAESMPYSYLGPEVK